MIKTFFNSNELSSFVLKLVSMSANSICLVLLLVMLTTCGEYGKIQESFDTMIKYEAAKKYFDEGKYNRTVELLEGVVPLLRGTLHAEESLYLLARAYYSQKEYDSASGYFKNYYTTFPHGEYAELAYFYAAYSLYLNSPNPCFDQSVTYQAIQQFQNFMEYYPQSEKKEIVQNALVELQEKLALKELISAQLYYNLGDYMLYPYPGGNYISCVITAQNAMQSYPYSKYREDFMYYIFKSKYEIAIRSVEEKKDFRYRDVIDEYNSYINNYPQGKYLKEIQKLYNKINKDL